MQVLQPVTEEARAGARKILTECLRLNVGDRLTILYDETTATPSSILIEEAQRLCLVVEERFVSTSHQLAFRADRGLCGPCSRALRNAAAVLTFLSDSTETTQYRREILRQATNGNTRVGHVPGASVFILESAITVDYQNASARCQDLALALTLGETARIESYELDAGGEPLKAYVLEMGLGGFSRRPVVSTGFIARGTWGNLPGGETFIAPVEGTASGEIAINGAFKHTVLTPPDVLIFRVEQGQFALRDGTDYAVSRFDRLLRGAMESQDSAWRNLGELGIGVHEGVSGLTGNSLFDEKCSGTVHIALGDNSGFGGRHHATVHEDFVTVNASLWIDGRPILLHGRNALDARHWYDDIATTDVDASLTVSSVRVALTAERASFEKGIVETMHHVVAGRMCSYRVGEERTSRMLAPIYKQLRQLGPTTIDRLFATIPKADLTISLPDLQRALTIMLRHRLVSIV